MRPGPPDCVPDHVADTDFAFDHLLELLEVAAVIAGEPGGCQQPRGLGAQRLDAGPVDEDALAGGGGLVEGIADAPAVPGRPGPAPVAPPCPWSPSPPPAAHGPHPP